MGRAGARARGRGAVRPGSTAREAFGRLDVAVANAGFGVIGRVEALSLDDFRRQFETNVFGVLRTVEAALPELRRSRGSVAIMGSASGYLAVPGMSAYSMSKFDLMRPIARSAAAPVSPPSEATT